MRIGWHRCEGACNYEQLPLEWTDQALSFVNIFTALFISKQGSILPSNLHLAFVITGKSW